MTLLIIFIATFIRSIFGFAGAAIAMPLLAITLGIQTATPLFALVETTVAFVMAMTSWRSIDFKAAGRLVIAAIAGIPVGIFLLKFAPESLVVGALGLLLILFGFYRLTGWKLPQLANQNWAYLFGFTGGIFGGAYNIQGPLAVVYGSLAGWQPREFRATLQGYFLPTYLVIVISHALNNLWTQEIWQLYLLSLPVVFTAIWLGSNFNRRLPIERFQKLLFVIFMILGGLLLFQGINTILP